MDEKPINGLFIIITNDADWGHFSTQSNKGYNQGNR